jgi:hypothetical protein
MGSRPDRAEERKAGVATRVAETAGKTPQQRLAELDQRFGPGLGAAKERARLQAALGEAPPSAAPASPPAPTPATAQLPPAGAEELARDASTGTRLYRGADARITIRIGGRDVPILSLSQIRRLGEQEGFDSKPFVVAFRTQLKETR